MQTDRFLTRRQLLDRGWTRDLFQFLPSPDQVRENPRNLRGAPIKLYRTSTIAEVEGRESFKAALQDAAKRKEGAQKALETKRRKFAERIAEEPPPEIPTLSRAALFERCFEGAALDYLLAQVEGYRCSLMEKFRGADIDERQQAIDQKILDTIAAAHPWLKGEINRRMEKS